jgi:uncharacterized protein
LEYLFVPLAALLASGLTLFSGFGLGTLLMPVMALFFPLPVAIAMTAVVHLANNLFKAGLLGRHAEGAVLLRFGLPAMLAAFAGAALLGGLASAEPLFSYPLGAREMSVTALKLVIGALITLFAVLELSPAFAALAMERRYLPLGGLVSGFFGGLSGHQGAFRSMFLIKAGLDKEAFIATGVLLAIMVDCARLAVYGASVSVEGGAVNWALVALASLAAFVGAYLGRRLLHKVTLRTVQILVSVMLVVVGLGMMGGVL